MHLMAVFATPPAATMGVMPRIPVAILGALFIALALVAGAACGFGSVEPADSPPTSPPAVDSPPNPSPEPSPSGVAPPSPKPSPSPIVGPDPDPSPEPSGPDGGLVTGFTDGQWLVNDEIAPGRYRTVLPAEEAGGWLGCNASAEGPGVFEWEYGDVGHVILDVPNVDGAVVEASGCGAWERID